MARILSRKREGSHACILLSHVYKLIYTRDNSQHRLLACEGDSPTVCSVMASKISWWVQSEAIGIYSRAK